MKRYAILSGILTVAALLIAAAVALRGPRIRITVTKEMIPQKVHPLYQLIAARASIDEIRDFLSNDPGVVNSPLDDGNYAIHYAAAYKRKDVVELLLQMGANINARVELHGDYPGCTPLHSAVSNNDVGMVDLLLERGADPRIASSSGQSPIGLAKALEYQEVSERLDRAVREERTSGSVSPNR